MVNDKEVKKKFRAVAQKDPEKHYPVSTLKEHGFTRKQCSHCGNFFWSTEDRNVCGEPECSGGYKFIGESPVKDRMDFIEVWKRFSKMFKGFGYTPVARYPVIARWNPTTYFTMASITDFQPYVVSGEVDPPANPLIVPQMCMRFNDIDNVGITGRHYTSFVMIGQHTFQPPRNYNPALYLSHIHEWLTKGVGLPENEIVYHEDAWAGGGNFGPSLEFFARGLELGNQVYMQYEVQPDGSGKDLNIKVLDMGMGQERFAWITHGTDTSYEANMPTVVSKLYKKTGIVPNRQIVRKFLPHSGLLNIDEVDDIEKAWSGIANKIGIDAKQLKDSIIPLSGLYSVADHARTLLFAITDGGLPSNVGGGYNFRVVLRRALDFIRRYGWKIDLSEVCEWHAKYLKPQYPELIEHLGEVTEILDIEKKKYEKTKEKAKKIVIDLSKKSDISIDNLIELYDSNGISPEMLKESGLDIDVPADFYTKVSERHARGEAKAQTEKEKKLDLPALPNTEILYFKDAGLTEFRAKVVCVIKGKDEMTKQGKDETIRQGKGGGKGDEKGCEKNYVVLDKTAFYPTSGGQIHDKGSITVGRGAAESTAKVLDVFKQGGIIIHEVDKATFREGEEASCKIEEKRRMALARHHTSTHIINGASRKILGEHIWQSGAEKTEEKARLDITHYDQLTRKQVEDIEDASNEVIKKNVIVESLILGRQDAEKKFGFRLYQGGAVPGKVLRVVNIPGFDVEACGGTHLSRTGQAEIIKVLGTSKVQDGVVRIEFAAGEAARKLIERRAKAYEACAREAESGSLGLNGSFNGLNAGKYSGLMAEKDAGKLVKKSRELDREILAASEALSVPESQLEDAFRRFSSEIKLFGKGCNEEKEKAKREKAKKEQKTRTGKAIKELGPAAEALFSAWKKLTKERESRRQEAMSRKVPELISGAEGSLVKGVLEGEEFGMAELIQLSRMITAKRPELSAVLVSVPSENIEKDGGKVLVAGASGALAVKTGANAGALVAKVCGELGGRGGGRPDTGQGAGTEKDPDKIRKALEKLRAEPLG